MSFLIEEAKKKEEISKIAYFINNNSSTVSFYLNFSKLSFDIFKYVSKIEIELNNNYKDIKITIDALEKDEEPTEKVNIFYYTS